MGEGDARKDLQGEHHAGRVGDAASITCCEHQSVIEIMTAGGHWALPHGQGVGSCSRAGAHGWSRSPQGSSVCIQSGASHHHQHCHILAGTGYPAPRAGFQEALWQRQTLGYQAAAFPLGRAAKQKAWPGMQPLQPSSSEPAGSSPSPPAPARAGQIPAEAQQRMERQPLSLREAGDSTGTRGMAWTMGDGGREEHRRACLPLHPCSTHGLEPPSAQPGTMDHQSMAAQVPREGGVHAQGPLAPAAPRVIRAEQEPQGWRSWS